MSASKIFKSFFLGGFECSTHRTRDGRRLDLVAATGHDRFAAEDYERLVSVGIRAAREGLRWHLVERTPSSYDFSSVLPILRAARQAGVQIVWDFFHYGYPDDLDIFGARFVDRFARLAREFARILADESDEAPLITPVNEISFLSWSGGESGEIGPFAVGRGYELKKQLIRAAIAAVEAVRAVSPRARVCCIEPVFNVVAARDGEREAAEAYRRYQFQAWDMLAGRLEPQLGGREEYLDVVGVNYYPWNQWYYAGPVHAGATIDRTHPQYKPFSLILREVFARYRRPVFVSETGSESDGRADWLNYVCAETRAARLSGVPVEGVCLYPIVDFPGWENDRACENGLWGYADDSGHRSVCEPFARELERQQALFAARRRPCP
jgi:beta-glucosidase/6-phospho-beta-glucosidase/beta-galactosidase